MQLTAPSLLRPLRMLSPLRWSIPLALTVFTCAYFARLYWVDQLPVTMDLWLGVLLFGILVPLALHAALTRVLAAAQNFEQTRTQWQKQQRQLETLNAVGMAVHQSLELDTVLQKALDSMLDVLELDAGEVRLIQNGQLQIRRARGVPAELVTNEQTIPLDYCLCGRAAQRGSLIAVADLDRLPAYRSSQCACTGFRTVVAVPIAVTNRVLGVIHVGSHTPRELDDNDRALLNALGQHIGAAIEKAQLHDALGKANRQLEERVTERTRELVAAQQTLAQQAAELQAVLAAERTVEEKTRASIAHDLHDGVQQLIVAALFETQAVRNVLHQNPDAADIHLKTSQALLRDIETEMRRTIYQLRPLALDAHGLVPALRECAARFERLAHIPCTLHIEGTPTRLSAETELAVFRILQEALNNTASYAQATHVHVRLSFAPPYLRVQVQDNGVGFDPHAASMQSAVHLGLRGMQERAANIGGTLEIESFHSGGTQMRLTAPMAEWNA